MPEPTQDPQTCSRCRLREGQTTVRVFDGVPLCLLCHDDPDPRDDPQMDSAELLADIRERIARGIGRLETQRRTAGPDERLRLISKISGMQVVLDMLRAYDGVQVR